MKKTDTDGVISFSVHAWDRLPWVVHGFFARTGGASPAPYASLNVGPNGGDGLAHVRENLRRIARTLSIQAETVFCASQVHGDQIRVVTASRPSIFDSKEPLQADGLLTTEKGLYLGILTADCVPLLLVDPKRSVVAAVHAGWRGTRKGITEKTVREMHRTFGCDPADILVAVGPAVGPCCYAVGDEVAQGFLEADRATERFLHPAGSGRWRMNLAGMNRHQLRKAGIPGKSVFSLGICTSCRQDLFFSARADGEPTGRQISLIGLRPDSSKWEPDQG